MRRRSIKRESSSENVIALARIPYWDAVIFFKLSVQKLQHLNDIVFELLTSYPTGREIYLFSRSFPTPESFDSLGPFNQPCLRISYQSSCVSTFVD